MPASTDLSYWQVLRQRRLAGFLGGDFVSKAGDGMLLVALPLQMLYTYDGGPASHRNRRGGRGALPPLCRDQPILRTRPTSVPASDGPDR